MIASNLTMSSSQAPISNEQLVQLQMRLQLTFPVAYVKFLSKFNGGRPKPDTFKMKRLRDGKQSEGMIDWFYSAGSTDESNDLEREFRLLAHRLPPNLLPIAHDPGGNQICISLSGEHIGKVLFWDCDGAPENYLALQRG